MAIRYGGPRERKDLLGIEIPKQFYAGSFLVLKVGPDLSDLPWPVHAQHVESSL